VDHLVDDLVLPGRINDWQKAATPFTLDGDLRRAHQSGGSRRGAKNNHAITAAISLCRGWPGQNLVCGADRDPESFPSAGLVTEHVKSFSRNNFLADELRARLLCRPLANPSTVVGWKLSNGFSAQDTGRSWYVTPI